MSLLGALHRENNVYDTGVFVVVIVVSPVRMLDKTNAAPITPLVSHDKPASRKQQDPSTYAQRQCGLMKGSLLHIDSGLIYHGVENSLLAICLM